MHDIENLKCSRETLDTKNTNGNNKSLACSAKSYRFIK